MGEEGVVWCWRSNGGEGRLEEGLKSQALLRRKRQPHFETFCERMPFTIKECMKENERLNREFNV